jgi:hypothetical protein
MTKFILTFLSKWLLEIHNYNLKVYCNIICRYFGDAFTVSSMSCTRAKKFSATCMGTRIWTRAANMWTWTRTRNLHGLGLESCPLKLGLDLRHAGLGLDSDSTKRGLVASLSFSPKSESGRPFFRAHRRCADEMTTVGRRCCCRCCYARMLFMNVDRS